MSTLRPGDVSELAGLVRDAARGTARGPAARATPLRIRGAGTWMDTGTAGEASTLDLGAFGGVRTYAPDDLTITVGAATTLAELDAATRPNGQWCPLLPWGGDAGTVGATVATATTGPFAGALGRPRDLVLGLECVDGRGRLVRAGGRVVKNVAGFDLTRLMTGAWGTLGVITELHLRLRARPPADETFALSGDAAGLDAAVRALARGAYSPLAIERVTPGLARTIGAAADARWLVRIGGNTAYVAAARSAYSRLARLEPLAPTVWDLVRARNAGTARPTAWRWDALSRRIKALFDPADILNRGLLGDPA